MIGDRVTHDPRRIGSLTSRRGSSVLDALAALSILSIAVGVLVTSGIDRRLTLRRMDDAHAAADSLENLVAVIDALPEELLTAETLDDLVERNVREGRLSFSVEAAEAILPPGYRGDGDTQSVRAHLETKVAPWTKVRRAAIEKAESLEQLRALALGLRIHVTVLDEAPPPGVDTPEDLERVRALFV